jgi:PBP1b-binding outer membrane lipoprotein LpoB
MKQMMLLAVAAAFLGGCASVASEPMVVAPAAEPVVAESVVEAPKAPEVPVQPEPVVVEVPETATEALSTQGEVAAQTAARGQGGAQGEFSMTIRASGRVQSDAAMDATANAQGAAEGESRP